MRRLTLIRHGLTEGNVRRWYYGALDLPLCEAGADALREAAAAGLYPPIGQAKILTSGLLRTEQTLRLLYGDVPHEVWPDLREISFGIFEGKSYDELNGRADYAAWLAGDWFGNVPPGGESFESVIKRTGEFLAELLKTKEYADKTILVSTHGCALKALLANVRKTPVAEFWGSGVHKNCAVTILETTKDGKQLTVLTEGKLYY